MRVVEILYEDWGSSDWYGVLQSMDKYIDQHGLNPQNIEDAANEQADFYYKEMGYDTPEDAQDRIVQAWLDMTERGRKLKRMFASKGSIHEEKIVEEFGPLSEAAVRQWRRVGKKLVRKYRCMSGKRAGKLVKNPGDCGKRKDPKKVRTGRKVMRSKKGIIKRKSKIAKRQQISKLVTKLNARLMGKDVKPKKVQKHKTMS